MENREGGSTMSRHIRFIGVVLVSALLWAKVICFVPSSRRSLLQTSCKRGCVPRARAPTAFLQVDKSNNDVIDQRFSSEKSDSRRYQSKGVDKRFVSGKSDSRRYQSKGAENRRKFLVGAALFLVAAVGIPSQCSAANILSNKLVLLKGTLVSTLDTLSQSGTKGMAIYALSFIIWTMTVGVTTPVETAAGMAFPLAKSIPLSAVGKIGGAFFQYTLAKYLFSEYARKKMKGNEWMGKINHSFQSHPFRVALIWRFSPLPEFVKNVGPALVPTLRTRYQILAILTHGLPFTVLWSLMGNEAAIVARGVSSLIDFGCSFFYCSLLTDASMGY